MAVKTHILDPEGDMVLVLKNPNRSSADSLSSISIKDLHSRLSLPARIPADNSKANRYQDGADGKDESGDDDEVKYRVSSKHLTLCSGYFRAALSGPWKRDMEGDVCRYEVHEWNPEALLIVLQIIHGKTEAVDKNLHLEMVVNVAVVVDYFQCPGPVTTFAETWMDALPDHGEATTVTRDLVLSIFVALVFGLKSRFSNCTRTAMVVGIAPIPTLGLPIPTSLIGEFPTPGGFETAPRAKIFLTDAMEEVRREQITEGASVFKNAHKELTSGKHGCSPSCRLSLHRALFERADTRIINEKPWEHLSMIKVDSMARTIQAPYDVYYKGHKGPYLKAVS